VETLMHQNGIYCESCSDKLATAHPKLNLWFLILKNHFPSAHIAWAFRGQADQDKAFAEGKSRLRWPRSKHNNMANGVPQSLALDLFFLENGAAKWDIDAYRQIAEWSENDSYPIKWGGSWKRFKDNPHFELTLTGTLPDQP
jgi:hypothetical protein